MRGKKWASPQAAVTERFSTGTLRFCDTLDPRRHNASQANEESKKRAVSPLFEEAVATSEGGCEESLFIRGLKTNETIMALLKI